MLFFPAVCCFGCITSSGHEKGVVPPLYIHASTWPVYYFVHFFLRNKSENTVDRHIPSSVVLSSRLNEKSIRSRVSPALLVLTRQSTCPLHPGCARTETLRLLVNVPSSLAVVVASPWLTAEWSSEKAQSMVGEGRPIAQQLNTTSLVPSCSGLIGSLDVFTSEIPLLRESGKTSKDFYYSLNHNLHQKLPQLSSWLRLVSVCVPTSTRVRHRFQKLHKVWKKWPATYWSILHTSLLAVNHIR